MGKSVISDMDGVLYRGGELIPGADLFVERMLTSGTKFIFLTNNSEQTPLDLVKKLEARGIKNLTEEHFITSAMATAMFLADQKKDATVFVLGGPGLSTALYNVGFSITESAPDYVVVGKTNSLNYASLAKAVQLINEGAIFIGTNPDVVDPTEEGVEPACGTILAAIEAATGKKPYIVGKPNSLMMMQATKKLGVHADDTVMIGDRMDTDIVGGLEAGMTTCLVLSGVTKEGDIANFPYRPDYVYTSVAEIEPEAL